MERCTYHLSVMTISVCPRTSLTTLDSTPFSVHSVAKVWRSVWKQTSLSPALQRPAHRNKPFPQVNVIPPQAAQLTVPQPRVPGQEYPDQDIRRFRAFPLSIRQAQFL